MKLIRELIEDEFFDEKFAPIHMMVYGFTNATSEDEIRDGITLKFLPIKETHLQLTEINWKVKNETN